MKPRKSVYIGMTISAGLCLVLAGAVNAFAQAAPANCRADVAKFCSHTEPGQGRIARCLSESQWQLSPACQQHAEAVSNRMSETLQACKDEALQYCSSAEVNGGQIAQCLKREQNQLSSECKTLANLLQKN